jgi:hypothetical protein
LENSGVLVNAEECFKVLFEDLKEYLGQYYKTVTISDPGKEQYKYTGSKINLYTSDHNYLMYSVVWHRDGSVQSFLDQLVPFIGEDKTILEVGCETAFSGLTLAMIGGNPLTIHDYFGIGPMFALWCAEKHGLDVKFVPYGVKPDQHDWVVATDVLEHSGNHLLFLKWIEALADKRAITYPTAVEIYPPYAEVLDEWVDDNVIASVILSRNDVDVLQIGPDGRRYIVYSKKVE